LADEEDSAGGTNMPRNLITFVISYAVTRLLYWFFHFKPVEALPVPTGLLLDFTIWVASFSLVYGILSRLGIGRVGGRNSRRQAD
jgi:hypothetical protein